MMEDIPSQEMERRLAEHFAEESQRLRAPPASGQASAPAWPLTLRGEGLHGEDCFHSGNGALYMLLPPLR